MSMVTNVEDIDTGRAAAQSERSRPNMETNDARTRRDGSKVQVGWEMKKRVLGDKSG